MKDDLIAFLLIFGTLALIIGFVWSGAKVSRAIRWKHLFYVAIGTIVATLIINSLVLWVPISILAVAVACIQTFVAMGIGGAIANAIKEARCA